MRGLCWKIYHFPSLPVLISRHSCSERHMVTTPLILAPPTTWSTSDTDVVKEGQWGVYRPSVIQDIFRRSFAGVTRAELLFNPTGPVRSVAKVNGLRKQTVGGIMIRESSLFKQWCVYEWLLPHTGIVAACGKITTLVVDTQREAVYTKTPA